MSKKLILMELAKLELDTSELLSGLDVSRFERQVERLVRRAESEHAARAKEIAGEIAHSYWSTFNEQRRLSEAAKEELGPIDPILAAELAEERLAEKYTMAQIVLPTPFIEELAREQRVLLDSFTELRLASTLKMVSVG